MPRPEKIRLGEILVQQALITEDQLTKLLEEQKRSGRKLGRVFVESGYVTETQISEALARQLQIPFIDLKQYNTKTETLRKLPEAQARRFRAIVLEDRDNSYLVGIADPTDLFAYDEIARLLRREIELAVVLESYVLQVIDRTYRHTEKISSLAQELGQELGDSVVDFATMGTGQTAEEAQEAF